MLLNKHFVINIDYINLLNLKDKQDNKNLVHQEGQSSCKNFARQEGQASSNNEKWGGHNKQTVLLNVKTFRATRILNADFISKKNTSASS
jgi:hypothetical protein